MEAVLYTLVAIVVLGVLAQWIAWRLGLPSILLLLSIGLLAGPVTGRVDPDQLLGDLLLPVVSLSVAVILFEGGLSLRLRELRQVGPVVRNLCSVGAAVTWLGGTLAAHFIFAVPWRLSLLIGGLFIVTGPTVIGPMLRQIRPTGGVGPALKWEGIVTDPLGVMVAILVFESMVHHEGSAGPVRGILLTVGLGGGLGIAGALTLAFLLRRHLVPEHLQNPAALMFVLLVFAACESLQPESGLFAVTLMGVVLANQRRVDVRHIIEFKESLQVLLLALLFIVLSARVDREMLAQISWRHGAFLAALMFLVRPGGVLASTLGTSMPWHERAFLCFVAPRGIVSAAMAAVIALELSHQGVAEANMLVPLAFFVIIGTVLIYGLAAPVAARVLGLASTTSRGLVILGAHAWSRDLAKILQSVGGDVLLVDTNARHIAKARLGGLSARRENLLAEGSIEALDLSGKGRFLAMTSNDEVNALACLRMQEVFGRVGVYQLMAEEETEGETELELGGRRLFGEHVSFRLIGRRHSLGWRFKATPLSENFDLADYRQIYGEDALPLFVVRSDGSIVVVGADLSVTPREDQRLVGLVPPESEERPRLVPSPEPTPEIR